MSDNNEKVVTVAICEIKHQEMERRFNSLEKLITDRFDKLEKGLYGNGKPGLFQRVDRLEFNVEKISDHLVDEEQEKKDEREGFRFWLGPLLKVVYPMVFGVVGFAVAHYVGKL